MPALLNSLVRFEKYFKNTSWILGEKIIGMAVNFGIAILVARYFGPELFGVWSYALSLVGLFAIAGHMGLSGLAVRELVSDADNVHETLGTVFILKLLGMCSGVALLLIYIFIYETVGSVEFWILLIVGSTLTLRSFSVIQFWFESQVQARYAAIGHLITLVIVAGYKVTLIINDTSLVLFASSSVVEAALSVMVMVTIYKKTTGVSPLHWRFSGFRAKKLIKKGSLIFVGAIFGMVYLNIDQVMLRWLVGPVEVGIYAVAARLSSVWYFIPNAIVASFFPRLVSLKKQNANLYSLRLQQVFDLLFVLALIVAICISIVSTPLINIMFGQEYRESSQVLNIHIWAGIFVFMRAGLSKWILIEDVLVFSMITQGLGAVANVFLNLFFIPSFGAIGAAWATLVSYAVASYFSLLVLPKTRPIFLMLSKAMVAPVRYSYNGLLRVADK